MVGADARASHEQQRSAAVKRERSRKSGPATRVDYRKLPLIPALVAAGGGFAALPAVALELGDVRVESSLGQPLRASIAYALAPNEALASTCVSLQPTSAGDSLPTISRATVSVAEGLISITGDAVVREPLMSMRLNVRCPYTVQLSRDYMLFFRAAYLERRKGLGCPLGERAQPPPRQVRGVSRISRRLRAAAVTACSPATHCR